MGLFGFRVNQAKITVQNTSMRICDIGFLYFTGKVMAKYRQTENLQVRTLSLVLNLNVAGLLDQIGPEFRILRGGCIISATDYP